MKVSMQPKENVLMDLMMICTETYCALYENFDNNCSALIAKSVLFRAWSREFYNLFCGSKEFDEKFDELATQFFQTRIVLAFGGTNMKNSRIACDILRLEREIYGEGYWDSYPTKEAELHHFKDTIEAVKNRDQKLFRWLKDLSAMEKAQTSLRFFILQNLNLQSVA